MEGMKMNNFGNVDEVLDFAIKGEEEAHKFYMGLARNAEQGAMRKVFEDFAREELGHKKKLLGIKTGTMERSEGKEVTDLKIGDYLVDIEPHPGMDYQEALIVAMKKEKAAFKLYTDLAAVVDNESLSALFLELAQEEAKHKLRFEIEYDEQILTDN